MVDKQFRNPWALNNILTLLGMLESQALGFLNYLVTLVLMANYYVGLQQLQANYTLSLTK